MDASLFIARKLKAKGRLAEICIAISFCVIILAVAISSGFRNEIHNGVSSISGDIQLTPSGADVLGESASLERDASYIPRIDSLKGVKSVTPVVYRAGIIKNGENIHGVMFKGTPRSSSDSLSGLQVSIPAKLARLLSLKEGDSMVTYFVGENVKVRKFKVRSVYESILDSDDKLIVHADMEDLQKVNGWDEDRVSAFEVTVEPSYRAHKPLNMLESEIGSITCMYSEEDEAGVYVASCENRYPQLFDWLNLIDFNVFFILLLMTVVAGFNMISGLLIMLFENISTIGLLKSLGMRDRAISKLFITSSSSIVLKGMLMGNAAALLFCGIQSLTHFVRLNPENYFLSFVPVHVNPLFVLGADFISYVVIILLMLLPSKFISSVDPADTVRVN